MQCHGQQRRLLRVEKDTARSIDEEAFAMLVLEGIERLADQVDQRGLLPIVVRQQIVRPCKRLQPSYESFALVGRVA